MQRFLFLKLHVQGKLNIYTSHTFDSQTLNAVQGSNVSEVDPFPPPTPPLPF